MSFVILGMLGAGLVLAAFAAGWLAAGRMAEKRAVTAEKQVGEEERRRLKAEQDAFRTLLNYNTEMAYGPDPNEYMNPEEGDATS